LSDKEICRACELGNFAKSNCIQGRGSLNPVVLFVGQNPGVDEDEANRVFIGDSGDKLQEFIDKYKITSYYITNAVKCHSPRNRIPTKAEVSACNIFLFEEVQRLKPKIIIPMGNTALQAILGETGIHSWRNRIIRSDTYNCDVLPTLHPAAILRNPDQEDLMHKDFQKLREYLANKVEPESRERVEFGTVTVVQAKPQMNSIFKKILKRGIMFFDTETNGSDVYLADELELTSISICCNNREAYVFPLTEYSENLKEYFIFHIMKPLLESEKVKICAQNLNFDAKVMKVKYGIETVNWWFDTMIAHYLIKPIRGTHNLHAMTWEYLADEAGGYDDFVRSVGGAHKIEPGPDLWYYNGLDSSVGYELMTIFEPILKKNGHWRIFREVLMEVSDDLMEMEIRGMQFDVPYIKELAKDYQSRMADIQYKMQQDEGVIEFEWKFGKKFNPKSHKDLKWLLFDYYNLPILKTSKKTKLPSTDKECIAQWAQDGNEFCGLLQEHRRLAKADSTYLSGLVDKLYEGGVSRTNYNLTITATGRTSSGENPELKSVKGRAFNMQNIPREKEIKKIMCARENHILVAGDLSQIELRALACIAKDEALLEAVRVDAHRGMGAAVYDIPFAEVSKEQRSVGKTMNFAIVYEVSAEGLAPRLTAATGTHWSVSDAENLISTLKARFSNLTKWKEFVAWHVKKYGFMVSPLGRRRYFSKRDEADIRAAINFPIQSIASDMMLIGLISVNKLIKERNLPAWAVNEIHDALVLECPDDKNIIKEVAKTLKEAMLDLRWPVSREKFDWLNVPILVDIEVGYNAGNMREMEV